MNENEGGGDTQKKEGRGGVGSGGVYTEKMQERERERERVEGLTERCCTAAEQYSWALSTAGHWPVPGNWQPGLTACTKRIMVRQHNSTARFIVVYSRRTITITAILHRP